MKRLIASTAAAVVVLAAGLVHAPGASAHERRTVAGKYTFVVGFLNEPAYLEEPNGIDLRITNAATNEPVTGVEKTLKADIIVGGQTKTVDVSARFGQQGAYTANIIPTKAGTWVFRFHGTIEGQNVDERFESGPGRFNDVQAKTELQFPVTQPSIGDLAAATGNRTDATSGAAPAAGGATTADVQRALDSADSAKRTGMILGIAGILAGLAGLAAAAYALTRRPGSIAATTSTTTNRRGEPL